MMTSATFAAPGPKLGGTLLLERGIKNLKRRAAPGNCKPNKCSQAKIPFRSSPSS